ncbi:hypothetical protein MNBD_GAMMA12-74 [hydrothermal vent metagenome]|uniref:Uncharacterized protein n=1 Tax=hydrothermal vent metagenome TaxID=652676 RepID=A0A3B0YBP5_9ZZZZ
MECIVKGLYYQEFKEVLIKNRVLSLFHPEGLHPNKTNEISRNFSSSGWHEVNNGTCRYVFIKMDLTDIVLFLELFNSIKLYYVIQVNRELESTAKHKI